jgi:pyruvate kinase
MLSSESATGQYPVETVEAMARVCIESEKEYQGSLELRRIQSGMPDTIEEAITRATMFTAGSLKIAAIAALTQSGFTAMLMSRKSSNVPIFALSPQLDTRRKVTLFRGVYPINFNGKFQDPEIILNSAENELLKRGVVKTGDLILMTIGEPVGKAGGTNTMKIVKVGDRINTKIKN